MKSFKDFILGEAKPVYPVLSDVWVEFGSEGETETAAKFLEKKGMNGLTSQDYSYCKLEFTDEETAKDAYRLLKNKLVNEAEEVVTTVTPAENEEDPEQEELEDVSTELAAVISDLTDEEKEILLMHAYALILSVDGDSEDDEGEELEESEKPIIVTYEDSLGNKQILTVSDEGGKLSMINNKGVTSSISNIAFMISQDDFEKGGYENSGTADKAKWVKNSALQAWKESKGNSKKFATTFSKLMKLKFYPSDAKGDIYPVMTEATIDHLTSQERTASKLQRRIPKYKRKIKIRYIRNKKCPEGTTWSSVSKSCTRKNIDLSRIQKMISKMKIRTK